jgi:flagellar biosynthesis chaperone FliJ
MKHIRILAAVAAIFIISLAAAAQSTNQPETENSAPKKHAGAVSEKNETAEQLRVLKEAIDQQQAALQQLQQQLKQTQDQLKQTQQAAQQTEDKAAAVESASQAEAQKVQSDLNDVHATLKTAVETAKTAESKATALEHPTSIAYKGIRLSPGGFIELTQYYRAHATLNDVATVFQSTPLEAQGSSASGYNAHLSEYGISARSSRLSLRADADAGSTKLAGYFEIDFDSAAPTSNNNQSTSYTPRLRQAWARTTFANGWTITGGQPWSLITLNRKGTTTDNATLWIPNSIEAQYSVGYNWGRFGELRVSKTLNNLSLAVALDNPQSLPFGQGTQEGVSTAGGGLDAGGATYSTNLAPDLLIKIAYDNARLGHYEIKALGRAFRDRVASTSTTNVGFGDGIGGGAVIPLLPKKIDFIVQGLYGKGISRYQDSGQYDFVVRSTDSHLQDIKAFSVLSGFETHPSPKGEFDLLFGDEYYYRSTYIASGAIAGYGAQTTNNSGFYTEGGAITGGNNRNLLNGKAIAYYDLYKGSLGALRYGLEADYVERATWSGLNGLAPRGNNKVGFATIRWILP